jgi:tripeptide aminopeptidase
MDFNNYNFNIEDRFIKYAKIDTQSDPHSNTYPSTEKQKNLGRILVEELKTMGLADAEMDEYGIVYATLPSNTEKDVPTICFCAHMDTSPDCPGENVKPIIHRNYDGRPIKLPDNPDVVIDPAEHKNLARKAGEDIITASGNTLLGADNKAGVVAILAAMDYLIAHPQVKHGDIRVLFTCDEEIGKGTVKVDMEKLGAEFGYTIDGEEAGTLENETFSADKAIVRFFGKSAHPGMAKDRLVSAMKVASAFIDSLPKDTLSPETTELREGFIHPVEMKGNVELTVITFILRDFVTDRLADYADFLNKKAKEACDQWQGSSYKIEIQEQYRNMRDVLDNYPQVVDYAMEAISRTGLQVKKRSIRGGTDGAMFSFKGMPCPNVFAGEHAFHSREEWVSVQDMEKSAETIVHIASIFEENA